MDFLTKNNLIFRFISVKNNIDIEELFKSLAKISLIFLINKEITNKKPDIKENGNFEIILS